MGLQRDGRHHHGRRVSAVSVLQRTQDGGHGAFATRGACAGAGPVADSRTALESDRAHGLASAPPVLAFFGFAVATVAFAPPSLRTAPQGSVGPLSGMLPSDLR